MGLGLLSIGAARDLGYIDTQDMAMRVERALTTLERLERHKGHLLNWYDTRSLEPLLPRYVSTVDNGNLAGCLLALKQGCITLESAPIMRPQRWQGLLDTISILQELLTGAELRSSSEALVSYLTQMRQQIEAILYDSSKWGTLLTSLNNEGWETLSRLILDLIEGTGSTLSSESLGALRLYTERVHHHLTNMQRDMELLLPLRLHLNEPPSLLT